MANVIEQIQAAEAAKLRALAKLHVELGYGSAQDLATAIREAVGVPGAAVPRAPKNVSADPAMARKGRRIDNETKNQVLAALKAGQSGSRVAKQFGISYPTMHNWKTALGLVNPRSGGRKSNGK